jgi:hypothetical protein
MLLLVALGCRSCDTPPAPPPPPPEPRPVGLEPAWSVDACGRSELGEELARAAVKPDGSRFLRSDVDGDGNPDLVDVRLVEGRTSVVARLTRTPETRLRFTFEPGGGPVTEIPAAGLSDAQRKFVERLLFPIVCERPDAALRAWSPPPGAPDVWTAGPFEPPPDYALRREDGWVAVAGLGAGGWRDGGAVGDATLRWSERGVVVVRPDRHRWLHVEAAGRVLGVEPTGDDAVDVLVEPAGGAGGAPTRVSRRF